MENIKKASIFGVFGAIRDMKTDQDFSLKFKKFFFNNILSLKGGSYWLRSLKRKIRQTCDIIDVLTTFRWSLDWTQIGNYEASRQLLCFRQDIVVTKADDDNENGEKGIDCKYVLLCPPIGKDYRGFKFLLWGLDSICPSYWVDKYLHLRQSVVATGL